MDCNNSDPVQSSARTTVAPSRHKTRGEDMPSHAPARRSSHRRALLAATAMALVALRAFSLGHAAPGPDDGKAAVPVTPVKHVIVVIGENRTFDHVFATYVPRGGDRVSNLLS